MPRFVWAAVVLSGVVFLAGEGETPELMSSTPDLESPTSAVEDTSSRDVSPTQTPPAVTPLKVNVDPESLRFTAGLVWTVPEGDPLPTDPPPAVTAGEAHDEDVSGRSQAQEDGEVFISSPVTPLKVKVDPESLLFTPGPIRTVPEGEPLPTGPPPPREPIIDPVAQLHE